MRRFASKFIRAMGQSRSSSKQLTTSRLRIAAGLRCSTFRSNSSHRRSARPHNGRERQDRSERSLLTNENPRPRPECSAAVSAFAHGIAEQSRLRQLQSVRERGSVGNTSADWNDRCESSVLPNTHQIDSRRGKNVRLPLSDLLRQSICSRLAGYEDSRLIQPRTILPTWVGFSIVGPRRAIRRAPDRVLRRRK